MNVDLKKIKKIHFVGIKGVAMTALAIYAKEAGYSVSGSDTQEEFPTSECLVKADILSVPDFSPSHIGEVEPDLVIYTGAHNGYQNPEVAEAVTQGISVLAHGKALGMFMEGKRQISVAGSHGKTTTTAMIAAILTKAGMDPSYTVGCGEIFGLGLPGHFGRGEWFIAEADEYATDPIHDLTPRFLWQHPEILVVTNIDFDHPDVFGSLKDVQIALKRFQDMLPPNGSLIISSDDPNSTNLFAADTHAIRVGCINATCTLENIHFTAGQTFFSITWQGHKTQEFNLHVAGRHNAVNAAMATVASDEAGATMQEALEALESFRGTKRRFEKIGERNGITYYDDYAHHPKEIEATLNGAREWHKNSRIIAVFQPHTYSRTKALMAEFGTCFIKSDMVFLTDIYASAREQETMGITGHTLYEEVSKNHTHVVYAPTFDEIKKLLRAEVKKDDIVIFMGAGDIYMWAKNIVQSVQ